MKNNIVIGIAGLMIGCSASAHPIYEYTQKQADQQPVKERILTQLQPANTRSINRDDSTKNKKIRKQIKKEKRKKMYSDLQFKIGDGVTVITGPLKDLYAVVVYYDEKEKKYLLRFTGNQQLFYAENEIKLWDK